jgi:hypothetical protein
VPSRLSAGGEADDPDGHRYNKQLQVMGVESNVTYTQILGKGMSGDPPPLPRSNDVCNSELGGNNGGCFGRSGNSTGKLPKLNFPEFTGDNPRLQISRCENYFDMYEVENHRWIQISSMFKA